MPTWRETINICDPWSYYDYKMAFTAQGTPSWNAPSWVPEHEGRRLAAYRFLEDMCKNRGRNWMDPETEEEVRKDRREYGDPSMIVSAVVSSVVGDSQTIRVDGILDEGDGGGPKTAQQELLTEWMKLERFLIKMMSNETRCSKLGDQVYSLGLDPTNGRPRIRIWDAGFYFPVLDDWTHDEDFPRKVHIAWEYEKKVNGKNVQCLRRITWELVTEDENDNPLEPIDYPWNPTPVPQTCLMYEYEWNMEDIPSGSDMLDLSLANAIEIMPPTDLNIDFLPVYHIPNLPAEDEHWGTSTLAFGMQILDDLVSTDTDLQKAASTTGSPPLGVENASLDANEDGEIETYGPGQVFGGKINLVDTSHSLDALLKLKEALQERVEVNLRVPKTLIGRIDPSKVNAGIILTLSFQPHSNMVRVMRMVRSDVYDLILKHVCRFYMQLGRLQVIHPCSLQFGRFLPSDRQEVSEIVREGITAHSMSLETAVALMIEAGYPIEDALLEVQLILSQNFEGAKAALEASADLDFARSLLGLPPATEDLGVDDQGNPIAAPDQLPEPPAPPA